MAKDLENTMVGNNIYILTELSNETTNGLIVQLTQWINKSPFVKNGDAFYKTQKIQTGEDSSVHIINVKNATDKIYGPNEEIPEHIPTLNVWINSGGGKDNITQSVLSMFDIASAKGAIIKTYNLRQACSNASIIAVSGTPGYRYMAERAFNYIHFGNKSRQISHENELEFAIADFKHFVNEAKYLYLEKTKLTKKELEKYYNIETSGILSAEQCLQKSLCDWVITNDGRFVNNVAELKAKQR